VAIRTDDGQYALDCWEDPDRDDVEASTDYSDSLAELRAHAERLIAGGRFRYLELSRWNADHQEWDELEVFEV